VFFGAGCVEVNMQPKPAVNANPIGQNATSTTPKAVLPDNVTIRSAYYQNNRNVAYAVVKLPFERYRFGLANDPTAPKTASAWRQSLGAVLAINGAYFTEEMKPAGYFRVDGKASGKWPDVKRQHEKSSYTGLVRIRDGRLALIHLVDDPQTEPDGSDQAFLSFPTLVANGKALIEEDSQKLGRRTALATGADGATYAIVTQSGSVSLREFAGWLATQPEKFSIAVNLDGGSSTGLSFSSATSSFDVPSIAPVPNVVAAYPR